MYWRVALQTSPWGETSSAVNGKLVVTVSVGIGTTRSHAPSGWPSTARCENAQAILRPMAPGRCARAIRTPAPTTRRYVQGMRSFASSWRS